MSECKHKFVWDHDCWQTGERVLICPESGALKSEALTEERTRFLKGE